MNFGVIIDSSASIEKSGQENFKKVLSFVEDLTQRFGVSKEGTHIGLLSYSDESKVGVVSSSSILVTGDCVSIQLIFIYIMLLKVYLFFCSITDTIRVCIFL